MHNNRNNRETVIIPQTFVGTHNRTNKIYNRCIPTSNTFQIFTIDFYGDTSFIY